MAIVDDEVTREAAKQEVIRRYFRYRCEYAMGFTDKETVQRVELFMKDFQLTPNTGKWWHPRDTPPRMPSGTSGEMKESSAARRSSCGTAPSSPGTIPRASMPLLVW